MNVGLLENLNLATDAPSTNLHAETEDLVHTGLINLYNRGGLAEMIHVEHNTESSQQQSFSKRSLVLMLLVWQIPDEHGFTFTTMQSARTAGLISYSAPFHTYQNLIKQK